MFGLNMRLMQRGIGLPKQNLLFYARLPNSESADWDEEALWEENADWLYYALPVSCYAAVGTGFWFTDATTPIPRTMTEILAWSGINQFHVVFNANKGLAVYDPYVATDATISKALKFMKEPAYDARPTAFFNGLNFTGATFDSGTLGTNPGQWVLDNTGTLVNAGVDVPAVEGARLEWVPSGVELITSGTFDSSTGLLLEGWSISGGVATSAGTGVYSLVQTTGVQISKKYRLTVDIASITSGGVNRRFGDSVITPPITTPGVFTYDAVVTIGSAIGVRASVSTAVIVLNSMSAQELIPVWKDTTLDGTPIVASTQQGTRTGPANTTFSMSDTFTPSTTFARYSPANPLTMPGFLSEPARTNKCTCRKANPVDTSGVTKEGDTASVLSVSSQSVLINNAGLSSVCTLGNLYKLDNSLGVAQARAMISSSTGNTNPHSYSICAMASVGTGGIYLRSDTGDSTNFTSSFSWVIKENVIPDTTTRPLRVTAAAGSIVYFILPQLEEGAFCTSPIAKLQDGSDPLTAITRAATVASFPTAGKIRSNDQGSLATIVPRATGQVGVCIYSTYTDASNYTAVLLDPTAITYRKRIAGINTDATVSITHTKDIPLQIARVGTSFTGMQLAARQFTGGTWSAWTNGTLVDSAAGKANAIVGTLYQYGSLNSTLQFEGNISLVETLLLPEGLTDPLAWAKKEWGIA